MDETLQGSCTVGRIVSRVNNELLRIVGDLHGDLLILQALVEVCDQKIYDTVNVFLGEWLVEHNLVEAVEKFGTEASLEQLGNRLSCFLADLSVLCDTLQNGA